MTPTTPRRRSARPQKGLFDFSMAMLCLWAAWFHTPVGALFRQVGAGVFRSGTSAQPLLSYFRPGAHGGVGWEPAALPGPLRGTGSSPVGVQVDPSEALGLGAEAVLGPLWPAHASNAVELFRREGLPVPSRVPSSSQLQALLDRTGKRLHSRDGAVVALFAGDAAASLAVRTALGREHPVTLEELALVLGAENDDVLNLAAKTLALATAYSLRWPVSETAPVTSGFGWREHPVLGVRRFHAGLDLGLPRGSEVRAAGDGEVRRASEDALNGKMVIVDHGNGVATLYCHNSELLVHAGASVHAGQLLARSGATGQVTGPHLHFQLELSDLAVDPLRFRRRSDASRTRVTEGSLDASAED